MTVQIAGLDFDHVNYDRRGDIMYLSVGMPRGAADSLVTPEGHVVRLDDNGAIIGLTIINAKWLSERDGVVQLTVPVSAATLEPAFA